MSLRVVPKLLVNEKLFSLLIKTDSSTTLNLGPDWNVGHGSGSVKRTSTHV